MQLFMSNLQKFRQLLVEGKISFDQKITTLVFNYAFKSDVEKHKKYELLNALINQFKKANFFIADSIEEWLKIKADTENLNLRFCN